MDLFKAFPALRRHHLLSGKTVALIGVSAIVTDDGCEIFEIGKPKYWRHRDDGTTAIGVGGIGGAIEAGETAEGCLRREVEEELGARVRLDVVPQTFLIHEWQVVESLRIPATKKRLAPLMVILVPPRLGGASVPDYLAIVAYQTRLRGLAKPHDLFGLLRVQLDSRDEFFARDEWPLEDIRAHPGLSVALTGTPPANPVLYPVLTGRAYQLLVRAALR